MGSVHEHHEVHVHVDLTPVLLAIEQLRETLMANIDELRASQAAGNAGLDQLGDLIAQEAAQVAQILSDLVAATGNQVTDADVAEAQAAVARIQAAGAAVSGIAPDAGPTGPGPEPTPDPGV